MLSTFSEYFPQNVQTTPDSPSPIGCTRTGWKSKTLSNSTSSTVLRILWKIEMKYHPTNDNDTIEHLKPSLASSATSSVGSREALWEVGAASPISFDRRFDIVEDIIDIIISLLRTNHSLLCTWHSLQNKCTCEFFAHPLVLILWLLDPLYQYVLCKAA